MIKKLVFIKDHNYSSNLYSNTIEYMHSNNLLNSTAAESNPYKIKLVNSKEAMSMLSENPALMDSKKVGCPGTISLVSFGGCVYHLDIEKMIELADKNHIASLVSLPSDTFSEAKQLSGARLIGGKIDINEDFCFIYLSLIKLEQTDIYYLVVNHTLVQAISNVEVESRGILVQQMKDIADSFKKSIFGIGVDNLYGNTVACTGGIADFTFFNSGLLKDRKRFFKPLTFDIDTINCRYERTDYGFKVTKESVNPGFVKFKVSNHLLGQQIKGEENLEWEYVLIDR